MSLRKGTHLPIPPAVAADDVYAPLVSLLKEVLLKPKDVAARWGQSEDHLSSMRRQRSGLPFIRLPSKSVSKGSVRYRLSDVISVEIMGTFGPLTLKQVCMAIASCPDVPKEARAKMQAHLSRALGSDQ